MEEPTIDILIAEGRRSEGQEIAVIDGLMSLNEPHFERNRETIYLDDFVRGDYPEKNYAYAHVALMDLGDEVEDHAYIDLIDDLESSGVPVIVRTDYEPMPYFGEDVVVYNDFHEEGIRNVADYMMDCIIDSVGQEEYDKKWKIILEENSARRERLSSVLEELAQTDPIEKNYPAHEIISFPQDMDLVKDIINYALPLLEGTYGGRDNCSSTKPNTSSMG